jgi:NDP-sugar pyrophosphorylase family protein
MKAIILAAGKGERLKEITSVIPKPMIKIKGKPILQHNIELCRKYGIGDIFINVHHLSEMITDYFGDGKKLGVNIKYSYEKVLLGTSGAVKKIAKEFWLPNHSAIQSNNHSSEDFFVIYGDNFSEYNLNLLIEKQRQTNSPCIIAFHYREDVSTSGVGEFDDVNRVLRFVEKPKGGETNSHWVNAGIYFLSSEILRFVPDGFSDFGKDIFPGLLKENIPLYGVCSTVTVRAFDNKEMYDFNMGQENDSSK